MSVHVLVAEVSRTCRLPYDQSYDPSDGGTLSRRFEQVISVNMERGYTLEDWRLTSAATEYDGAPVIVDTIVATFVTHRRKTVS